MAGSVDGAGAPTATPDGPSGNGSGAAASPVASPAAEPVTSTTTGPAASTGAPAQEDSLNLLKVAGPVILKRLVPVLIGAVGLAVLSRLFWRRRRGPGQAEQA